MSVIYEAFHAIMPFSWAGYKFMVNAFLAVLFIAPLMGVLGTMAVNNKMAFFSDALGHSALTGVALGVLLGVKNEMVALIAFGVLLALVITKVKNAGVSSADTVISVFSSASIALGLLVLSYGGGFQKYNAYLVGDILSITPSELLALLFVFTAVIVIWCFIYNKLLIISINRELAASRGIKTALYVLNKMDRNSTYQFAFDIAGGICKKSCFGFAALSRAFGFNIAYRQYRGAFAFVLFRNFGGRGDSHFACGGVFRYIFVQKKMIG